VKATLVDGVEDPSSGPDTIRATGGAEVMVHDLVATGPVPWLLLARTAKV
jgi:hypothetical protein